MKRIDIIYGAQQYSVGGREPDELRAEIEHLLDTGHGWLRVNIGEGQVSEAQLLITLGVPLTIIPIPDPAPE